jgi:hypothetical protein
MIHMLRIGQKIEAEHLHSCTLLMRFPTTDSPRPKHSHAGGYRHDRRREWM